MAIHLQWGDGCALQTAMSASEKGWGVYEATLASCGDLADFSGATLNAANSTFGLTEDASANAEESEVCVDGSTLAVVGRLVFTDTDDTEHHIMLDGLTFGGDVLSTLDEAGECAPTAETCATEGCGPDAFGIDCGECGEGFKCIDSQCKVWNCPPDGPFGTKEGQKITDMKLPDCDGNMHNLHDLCGAPAGYVNLLAGY